MLAHAERNAALTPRVGRAGTRPRRLIGFLAWSVALHGLVLSAPFSPLRPVATVLERPLEVKLAPPPVAPTLSRSEPIRLTSPLRRDRPAATSRRSARAAPEINPPALVAPPAATHVIAVSTAGEPVPTPVVPLAARSEVPVLAVAPAAAVSERVVDRPAVTANSAFDGALLDAYTRTLSVEVAKMRRYPAVARLRGWQGTAILTINLSATGVVLKTTVSRSSGHAVLDDQALRMLAEVSPLPGVPAALHGRPLVIELPVVFALVAS